jgi:hypothetical protein
MKETAVQPDGDFFLFMRISTLVILFIILSQQHIHMGSSKIIEECFL